MTQHPLNAAIEVRGYHQAGPGWVRGMTHESHPRYEIEFSTGAWGSNIPAEFVHLTAPVAVPIGARVKK